MFFNATCSEAEQSCAQCYQQNPYHLESSVRKIFVTVIWPNSGKMSSRKPSFIYQEFLNGG